MRVLGVFFSIIAVFFHLETVYGIERSPAQQKQVELTDQQALAVSEMMINAGDLDKASDLLNDILQSNDVNARTAALFELGRIAVARGDYSTARMYFLTILKWHPDYTRVRIELAHCYILMGNYERADFNLRLALGDTTLPDNIAQYVRSMLNYVRKNKVWDINAGLSIVPDTNLNYATGKSKECVDFGFGPLCRDVKARESSIGLRYNVGGDYYMRLSDRFSIRNTISLSALDFKTDTYDDYALYVASGPRYVADTWDLSVQPFAQMRWYGGKYYNTAPGIRLDSTFDLTRRIDLGFGVAFTHTVYDNNIVDRIWRSDEYTAYIQPRYYINNKSFVQLGLDYSNSTAHEKAYGYTDWGYSVAYYTELPWTLNLYTRFGMNKPRYKDKQYFITNKHTLERFQRKDDMYMVYLRLATRYFEPWRIYPSVSYSYSVRDSNVPAYEYSKHRIECNISYQF